MLILAHSSFSAPVLLYTLEGDFSETSNKFRINTPARGALTFKIESDAVLVGSAEVKFKWPIMDNCPPEPGGPNIIPLLLFSNSVPINIYENKHIPVSRGLVDITVSSGFFVTGPYNLLVYFTEEMFPSVPDKEPNNPPDNPLNLGMIGAYSDIDSHTGFPVCQKSSATGSAPSVKDMKDYFQFQFYAWDSGYYNLRFATETPFRDECEVVASLADDFGYIYYKWILNKQNEIGSFLMKAGKNYYIDVQILHGFNVNGCHSSLKFGFVPASSAWFHTEEIIHDKTTVCGTTETIEVVARNDGDVAEDANVYLTVTNPVGISVYHEDITINSLKENSKKTVNFAWEIPDPFKEKNPYIITGEYKIKASVTGNLSVGGRSTVNSSMDILCRPITPYQAFLILLLKYPGSKTN